MFRKIFKYDFRACTRIMLLLVPLVWFLAVFAAMLIRALEADLFQEFVILEASAGMGMFFSFLAIFCFPFVVLIFCLRRYYTHFFSDEGYLTFTLPVKRETLLWSKTLSAVLAMVIAAAAEIIAFLILIALVPGGVSFLKDATKELWEVLRESGAWSLVSLLFVTTAVSTVGNLATVYFCITQGFLLAKKHKILAAFGLWYGINVVKSTLSQVASIFFLSSFSDRLQVLESDFMSGILTATNGYIGITLFFETACLVLFYLWNQKLLKTKLSLT